VRSFWLPADDLPRLAKEPGLVRSGLAAAAPPNFDLFYFEPIFDAYLEQGRLQSLISRYRPLEHAANAPNTRLRVPSHRWVLRKDGAAPVAVVAADLLDHPDQRVRQAGRGALLNLIDSG